MKIEIEIGNIVDYSCDAIVNAANNFLRHGSGVCGAIFSAAESEKLSEECAKIGWCDTGGAVLTSGYNLKAKYIIHAVGPVYKNSSSGDLLNKTYQSILELSEKYNFKEIAIPAISTGVYGFPKEEAAKIAVSAVYNHKAKSLEKVYLLCFDYESFIYQKETLDSLKKGLKH